MPSYKLINDNDEYRFNNLNEIKNKPFFNNIISLNYISCNLTSFYWEETHTLKSLQRIYLGNNQLITFYWEGCPENLQEIYLYNNKLTSFSWEGCPENLQEIDLNGNKLTTFS